MRVTAANSFAHPVFVTTAIRVTERLARTSATTRPDSVRCGWKHASVTAFPAAIWTTTCVADGHAASRQCFIGGVTMCLDFSAASFIIRVRVATMACDWAATAIGTP